MMVVQDKGSAGHLSTRRNVRLLLMAALGSFFPLVVGAQSQPTARQPSREGSPSRVLIGSQSLKEWQRTIDFQGLKLPGLLPPADRDSTRPPYTFQKTGSSNWSDSAGNTYVRSAWGTWNNYDETKANPYPDLPDPLRFADGRPVADLTAWANFRRPEIHSAFSQEIFGEEPGSVPSVRWKVVRVVDTLIGGKEATTHSLLGHVDNSVDTSITVDIQLTLTLPKGAARGVPVIIEFGFVWPPGFKFPGMPPTEGPTWEEQVLGRDWGYAIYIPTSVQPDHAAGLTAGIIGLANGRQPRKPGDWGALRAWAWGASRVMDYLKTLKAVDANRIGIEGVSRYGKAVLLTMALDDRFAVALVGSSGKGGAALYRRDYGESMGNICSSGEFHWFAGNFLKYATNPNLLSVDAHGLIALCAPRPVFVSCGSPDVEGRWVDDKGQFMAEAAAGSVYALYGKRGLGTTVMPQIGTSLVGGTLAFRQHEDGHTIGPNWPFFIQFAQRQFEAAESSPTGDIRK